MSQSASITVASVEEWGVGDDDIRQRKDFLEFTEEDEAVLRAIDTLLEPARHEFAGRFYEHLNRFPETRACIRDEAMLVRLKESQSRYFRELTSGCYDRAYVDNRLRVGLAHHRIGLDTKWYIGSYARYLNELLHLLLPLLDGDPARFIRAYSAILKIVCFDIGLALESYHQMGLREIAAHKNYAAHLFECMKAGMAVLDGDGVVQSVNSAMVTILSLPQLEAAVGVPFCQLLPCEQVQRAIDEMCSEDVDRRRVIARRTLPKAAVRHLEINIEKVDLDGQILFVLFVQDITDRLAADARLRASEERFRMTFNFAAVGLAHVDASARILRVNEKLCEILGHQTEELLGEDIRRRLHPEDVSSIIRGAQRLFQGETNDAGGECRFRHKSGRYVWVKVTASALREDPDGFRYILVVEDISPRKQAEEKLLHLASHDSLTNLPNRMLVEDRLTQALVYAQRSGRHVAVLFVDLDRFKNVNDSLGHGAGDEVLIEVARRLVACTRPGDTVARLGGDEFVVVLTDVASSADVRPIAETMLRALDRPMQVLNQEVFLSGSIGISMFPKDGTDSTSLLKYADVAMYRAKETGRNNVQFYTEAMSQQMLGRLAVEAALRHAIERAEFVLHFQPQVDLATGRIAGVEALVRWVPAGRYMVQPVEFIPIAEETGLIVEIGEWVLREACRQHAAWRAAQKVHVRMSVNLSARQFKQPDLAEKVRTILHETGCDPKCIALEITESVVMDDPEAAVSTLRILSEMGVHLAIDDFGTGYSSLSYLKRFPIDTLKIDRSFVRDVTKDPDDDAIVRSVIALAHTMKMDVVAEGGETEEQREFLRRQGCEQMQGFLFGRPMPAEEIEELFLSERTGGRRGSGCEACQ